MPLGWAIVVAILAALIIVGGLIVLECFGFNLNSLAHEDDEYLFDLAHSGNETAMMELIRRGRVDESHLPPHLRT